MNAFSAYISPLSGAFFWILLVYAIRYSNFDSLIVDLFVWTIGSILYLLTIFFIETNFFKKENRLFTLLSALAIILERISPKLSLKFQKFHL